ncbi:MAG: PTS system mannose/fructose/sorbose family transporter subunit IID [Deltaproteobacteria bacterium]|nr:PTS system mannose/fructose/sorbose family transporter subunit IID [Deltaproteobacteria bacterium]
MKLFSLKLEQQIFLRSFSWQASWNFGRMQNMGVAYAIYPLLAQLYGNDQKQLTARVKRYLDFFNTNPVMAAAVLGILVHQERKGEGDYGLAVARSLNSLYGAIGDAFFWNGLKPLVAVLAVAVYFAGGGFWAPVVLLGSYNVVHLGIRYLIYREGIRQGLGIINMIHYWHLPEIKQGAGYLTIIILAWGFSLINVNMVPELCHPRGYFFFTAAGVCGLSLLRQRQMSPGKIFLLSLAAVIAVMACHHFWL